MASWRFVVTDNAFVPQGEVLNATNKQVALPLNRLDTASFQVRLDNPLADFIFSTMGYLKAYRNGVLRFFGPIITAEESGEKDRATMAVNAVGAGWVLTKRLAGKSSTGTAFVTAVDRAQIVKGLIDGSNGEDYTGIATTLHPVSAASAVTYTAGPYKPISECNTELSQSFDGFDWRILPVENFAAGGVTGIDIGSFWAAPTIGSQKPDVIYEWGTGRNNIATYKRVRNRESQANRVFHNAQAGPDAPGFPTVSALDVASITNWGLLEDLAQADLIDNTLRQRLVDEHVIVRSQPRQVLEFSPHIDPGQVGRLPEFGTEFDLGDSIRARIVYNDTVRLDAMVRLWGVQFAISDLGTEQQTFTLVEEG